jgi:hypothetical protein
MFFPTLTNTPCQVAATSHLVAGVLVLSTIAGFGGDVTCPASAVHMPFICHLPCAIHHRSPVALLRIQGAGMVFWSLRIQNVVLACSID